ncbi:ALTO [Betapolyomavirus securanorvegicus]|uniref:ALTO n=1 Tax=Betapolyomavirus securanorvegicus TaxID=1919247 RepID=A0A1J0MVR7_9POLY|nr:ALTO [Betapolyomavirus securanorvegicus]APD30545.1 ALTO [Betapolyomavirus securanorvegicus]
MEPENGICGGSNLTELGKRSKSEETGKKERSGENNLIEIVSKVSKTLPISPRSRGPVPKGLLKGPLKALRVRKTFTVMRNSLMSHLRRNLLAIPKQLPPKRIKMIFLTFQNICWNL